MDNKPERALARAVIATAVRDLGTKKHRSTAEHFLFGSGLADFEEHRSWLFFSGDVNLPRLRKVLKDATPKKRAQIIAALLRRR